MKSFSNSVSDGDRVHEMAAEMDRLFNRQVELMKTETFVGLNPRERQEYEKIGERIHQLFRELGKRK